MHKTLTMFNPVRARAFARIINLKFKIIMEEKTLGEIRVRTQFNQSKDSLIDDIKQRTAELINLVNCLPNSTNSEVRRLQECAINNYELAAMLAVKAATA